MRENQKCIVSVNAIVIYNGKIVLQTLNKEGLKGKIGIPGGKVEVGETFDEALRREIFEETGLTPDLYTYKHIGIIHSNPQGSCKHIYEIHLKQHFDQFIFDTQEIQSNFWVETKDITNELDKYRKPWVYYTLNNWAHGKCVSEGLI